jgi:lysyl-tRNA synthetase class 2
MVSNPETLDRFKKRSDIVRKIREYFHNKDFYEVETRILQPQAGGAMAKVFETHHNALDHDFVLRIATELDLKIACSGGLERVFEIGKMFRNEGIDPSHLQEFTSIEWYGAYDTLEMHETWIEELLREICTEIFHKTNFQILDKEGDFVDVDFSKPFKKITFSQLLQDHANIDIFNISTDDLRTEAKKLGIDDVGTRGRGNLLDDIYKKTARPKLIQPIFVTDWPSDLKPLARPHGDGTSSVSQLLIAGWEVTNGYGELIDPKVQRELLEEQQQAKNAGDDEAMEINEEFLRAMEHGFPPMAGNAIGIDRLICLLTGQSNLRDVVLFPTMRPENTKE